MERSPTDGSRARLLIAAMIPAVLVLIALGSWFGLGWLEIGLLGLVVLGPIAVGVAPALGFCAWARKRGDLG